MQHYAAITVLHTEEQYRKIIKNSCKRQKHNICRGHEQEIYKRSIIIQGTYEKNFHHSKQ